MLMEDAVFRTAVITTSHASRSFGPGLPRRPSGRRHGQRRPVGAAETGAAAATTRQTELACEFELKFRIRPKLRSRPERAIRGPGPTSGVGMEDSANLPIIDISCFLDSSSTLGDKKIVAQKVDSACRLHGFFYLKGHGISDHEMKAIRDVAAEFFSLPLEEKEKISIENGDLARGYQRLGQNITQYAQDWHEAIDLFAEVGPEHTIRKRGLKTLSGENPIVSVPANFNQTVDEYVEKMKRLGKFTMRAIALALGLDESFFEQFYNNSFWILRLIGYPPLSTKASQDGGISCGEHCDYGCLTLLNTDDTRGALQVLSTRV